MDLEPTLGDTAGESAARPPRDYQARKIDGWCTYSARCPRRSTDDSQLCDPHRRKKNKRRAQAQNRARAEIVGQGLCRRCQKPSPTYRCPACRILDQGTLPARQAKADSADPWRRDNDGWQRYRGKGQRGAPPAALTDEADIDAAVKTIERARTALAYAHSAPVRERGRDAVRAARAAAGAIIALVSRQLAEVAERNVPADPRVIDRRSRVREALGEGVEQEVIDDSMIDRVIRAAREAA